MADGVELIFNVILAICIIFCVWSLFWKRDLILYIYKCMYFLLVCGLPAHFPNGIFRGEVFYFGKL